METDVSNHSPSTREHQRLRLRFRKEGDLRWISHRDLVRTMERLLRRAALVLQMSEGFHPKPKLNFPSALALGIEGHGEWLELELAEPAEPQHLLEQLNTLAPPGLVITEVTARAPGQRKVRASAMHYQFRVPEQRYQRVQAALQRLLAATTWPIQREGRSEPLDLLADLVSIKLQDAAVGFCLRATDRASARPRDVLQALQLDDLEQQGQFLTRTQVEVAS